VSAGGNKKEGNKISFSEIARNSDPALQLIEEEEKRRE
jgi:hypothetical protein